MLYLHIKTYNKSSSFSYLFHKCTFRNSCSNSSSLLFKCLAYLVFVPISASPLLANIPPHPLLLPWYLQALVMHITLNLSVCPNLLMHTSPWPKSQKPNTIILAPISPPHLPFFLSLGLGVFAPLFFGPWSLVLFTSSTDCTWEDSFSVLPSTSNASQLQQPDLYFLQQSPPGHPW